VIILIEDAENQKYLANGGRWTKAPNEGAGFESTRVACAAAKKEPIGKFNIVLFIGETEQIINLDHGSGRGV
jgi:hypothetical protein